MKISDIMTQNPETISPNASLSEAAEKMSRVGCGALPVVKEGMVVGIITDRDIVVRALAHYNDPEEALVQDFMSYDIAYCFADQAIDEAVETISSRRVCRVPILDRNTHLLVGMVSLSHVAEYLSNPHLIGEMVNKVRERRKTMAA